MMKDARHYVTRWALSTGVRLVGGYYTDDGKYFKASGGLFVRRSEAFEFELDAKGAVIRLIRRKLVSIEKTKKKLEALLASLEAGGPLPMMSMEKESM
jgi:hypothetical protein